MKLLVLLAAAFAAFGTEQGSRPDSDSPKLPRLPKTAKALTPHGMLSFGSIELINTIIDRPCGFSARVTNPTGVAWEYPIFTVQISGVDLSNQRGQFELEVASNWIGSDPENWYQVWGLSA